MSYRELRAELQVYWDSGDAYGSVMGLWYPLAAVLTLDHSGTPPDWHYIPGGLGPNLADEDTYLVELYRETSEADLLRLGAVLNRAYRRIDARGDSY